MLITNPPVEIVQGLWMLGTAEYPLFLFRDARDAALFEGGTGAMGPVLIEQMAKLAIPNESVKQAVITHAHPDHVMAVPFFRQMFPGVSILASAAAAKTLAVEKAMAFFGQVDEAITSSLRKAGRIADEHRPAPLAEKRIAVDHLLKDGDKIAVGTTWVFEAIETPGHSDCSLSFYDRNRKVLLISDATGYYLPDAHAWWPNYFADYGAYLRSMGRLAGLEAEVLCLSHNAVVCGVGEIRSYFQGAIAATRDYHHRILDETKGGKTVRQIAEALGAEVHQRTQLLPLDFFQKNCGVLVKQSLRHEGIAVDK